MPEIDPPLIAELLAIPHPTSLGPGSPNAEAGRRLRQLDPAGLFAPLAVRDEAMTRACLAGLWLRFDFLDESHTISQEIETPTGSAWHAIMHRREGDFGNAKYWWPRVGNHPFLVVLEEKSSAVGFQFSTPNDFVDFCERVRDTGGPDERLADDVQALEWRLLFDHCQRAAVS